MKKLSIILLALAFVLTAGVAIAGEFYTAPNSTASQAFPAERGWPTINSISWTAGAATVDVLILGGDNTKTVSVLGKSATATTFVLASCTGIDDGDYVVIIQKPSATSVAARVLEVGQASACNDTTETITLAAGTANAFNGTNSFTFYEMQTITELTDIGTTKVTITAGPIWGGKSNWPMGIVLTGTGGTVHWLAGEWR